MLYKIDDKFYIKVQGYYKEVDVKVDGDNLDINLVPNGDEIEVYGFGKVVIPYDMMIDKDEVIKSLDSSTKFINKREEKKLKYNSRI
jgi:hypothetical protein